MRITKPLVVVIPRLQYYERYQNENTVMVCTAP